MSFSLSIRIQLVGKVKLGKRIPVCASLYISVLWRLLVLSPVSILRNKLFPYPHCLISKPLFILKNWGRGIGKLNTYVYV